jgi:hypothetical protein
MRTQKISFKGAYRTEIEQKAINHPLFKPNTVVPIDNTRELYCLMNPLDIDLNMLLFRPYNKAKAQLDSTRREVVLTNDTQSNDVFEYNKEISEPYKRQEEKMKNLSLSELRKEAKKAIAEDKLNITLEKAEKFSPEPYHINTFEMPNPNPKQFSIEEHLKMFLNNHFNTKMFEKEQKFYDNLKIELVDYKDLPATARKLANRIFSVGRSA